MLPSGVLNYNTAIISARYLPDGPAAPHAIGSLSVYTTTPHPNTQQPIQGFSWDARVWAEDGIENNVASIPMILDTTTSGIPSGYFQSGIGSGKDLRINSVELISSSGLSGRSGEDKWSPVIEHGYYYDFNEKSYLFSDDSEVATLTHSGVAIETGYLANSGFNQLQLSSIPKVGTPIIAEQFFWDIDEGKYKIALSLDNKTDFTGIRNASGVRADTYDSRTDIFYWDSIDRTKTEFVPLLNETPTRLIFNNQYVTSGEDTSLGVSDGSHNQEYHTTYCPIDKTTAIEVYSYAAPLGSPTYWTPIPSSGILTGYQAGIDYDLGLVRFGELEFPGEPVPPLGDTIGVRYWKTFRVEWEPENTDKFVEAIETNLNPIYRRGSQGFVYLRNTLEDPASITLESSSTELSLYNYGPIYIGNIPSTVTATVRDRNGQVLEDQIVTFYILSTPTVGSFGAVLSETDSPTDEEGEAKVYYHPPRTLDELGENILWSGYSQDTPSPGYTTLTTTNLSVEGAPEDVYLYKLYVDDPLQGYLDVTKSGDATSQLIEFYTKFFQDESIYGTTGLMGTGLLTASGEAIQWEDAHRTLWDLARPIIFSNSTGQGRKQLACVVSADMLNPHTFAPGAVAPMQPVSITSVGSNQYDVVFDTSTYSLPEPLASSPTPSGSLYGYFLVSPTKVALQASVWSTRYEAPIFSNKIYMHLQIPPYLSGVWIVDAINTNDLNEIAGLLNSHLTASGQRVPLGFRLRSTNVTLSSALDGITFLDVNSPWQDVGESPLLTPTQQLSDSYSPYWTSSGVFSVPTGDVIQSGIYLGQQVTVVQVTVV
jgi:hypothetical protein